MSSESYYSARLLLIDYGLTERTMQGICRGLDQLFSLIKASTGRPRLPLFALLANGQNQSEVFLPLSSPSQTSLELQVALCKLQLLGQKWAMKTNRTECSSSWSSALQLVHEEIKHRGNKNDSYRLVIVTNRCLDLNLKEIHEFNRQYAFDLQNIEVAFIHNYDETQVEPLKQSLSSFKPLHINLIRENKYAISLYFKSWLMCNNHDKEHVQLYIPKMGKSLVEPSCHLIRCDLQERLVDPYHHCQHDRFLISTEPLRISGWSSRNDGNTSPIYQLKAINFVKQTQCCISLVFGIPLVVIPTTGQRHDEHQSMESNATAFYTLVSYLRQHELMLICRLDEHSLSSANESYSGHFVLSPGTEHSLILRSVASSELLLPLPQASSEKKEIDASLWSSLSKIDIEKEEYNPFYYEARTSKITFDTNLI